MTQESPLDPRQALEASLTALLLGELPPDQAAFLRHVMSGDPELAKIYQRLKQTIELVRETETAPAPEAATEVVTLKLNEERRTALLQHFKTIAPREFVKPPRREVRWLLPVAAAVAFLALISAMMLPALSKAKSKSQAHSFRTWSLGRGESAEPQSGAASSAPSLTLLAPHSVDNLKEPSTGVQGPSLAAASPPPAGVPANQTIIVLPPTLAAGDQSTLAAAGPVGGNATVTLNAGSLAYGGYALSGPKSDGDKPLMLGLEFDKVAPTAVFSLETPPAAPPSSGVPVDQNFTFYRYQSANEAAGRGLTASGGTGGGGGYGGGIGGSGMPSRVLSGGPLPNSPAVNIAGRTLGESAAVPSAEALYANRFGDDLSLSGLNRNAERERTLEKKPEEKTKGGMSEMAAEPSVVPAVIDPTTGLPLAAASNSGGSLTREAEEALARRYGIRQGGVDPRTGLPSPLITQADGAPPLSAEALRKAMMNGGEPTQKVDTMDARSVLYAQDIKNGSTLSADDGRKKLEIADSAQNDTALLANAEAARRLERERLLSAEKYSIVVESLEHAQANPTSGSSVSATLRGFYNDEEKRAKDTKETAGKGQSLIVLPNAESQKQSQPALNGSLAQALPLSQQADANAAANVEQETIRQNALARKVEKPPQELGRLDKEGAAQHADAALPKPANPIPIPQPEIQTRDNAFSTFSLNVSDVSFKLAAASLEKGALPDPASIRSEEFINAFDYRDPEAPPGVPIAFAWERSRYPFAQNRDLLRFSLKTAALGRQAGRPLNLVLLLDNSGSMERADRVSIIREALRVLATQLQPQDTFSVVTFARTARLWVDGVPGNQAGQVGEELSKLTPQGGTNLGEAMDLAYQTALRHYLANGINRVVLLTDGAANLGDVEPSSLKAKVEANRKQGIALDCFGIGWEGYNDDLLEVLTRNGDGRYGFINTPEEAATEFAGQLAGALQVAASDVKVQVEFNPNRVTSYRQVGYAKHQLTKEQFRDNTVNAAQIGAAESGNALYVIETNPAGDGPLGTVRVRYRIPGTNDYQEREWVVPYTGNAISLEQSSPAMRLAASASAFSEWLATSPYAAEVTPDALLGCLRGVPQVYGADTRPQKLEWMVRQAKSVSGAK